MHRTERPRRQTVPINLILDGRPALVVGGGQVGRRKVMSLLDAGASVERVCPDAVDALAELAAAGFANFAVVRAVCGDEDPYEAIVRLQKAFGRQGPL